MLTQSAALADYFEAVAGAAGNAKAASNWVMGELLRTLNERGTAVADVPLPPAALAGLIALVDKGTISSSIAKDVFAEDVRLGPVGRRDRRRRGPGAELATNRRCSTIVRARDGRQRRAVAQYRAGKQQTFGFLVGQVMKGSGGKANPKLANAAAQARTRRVARPTGGRCTTRASYTPTHAYSIRPV